jgi:predicted ATP-binding protein involved in virulence
METINQHRFLVGSLQGVHKNADVTQSLIFFDYLRDSRDAREKRAGEVLYETARKIAALSLIDGDLLEVKRTTLTPMVRQAGRAVPLGNLSSGNAYMIQRMIGMLGKMHAVNTLRDEDPETMCDTPGLLLLDEAENHLHPRWQKRFLRDILDIFPNLQIIATTHSPFVTGSVPGARVYVCRYEREKRCSVVENVTQDYADKSVEDILASAAFEGTESFGKEITELLERRNSAIQKRDEAERAKIEDELYQRNPGYFNFLKLEEHLARLSGADE